MAAKVYIDKLNLTGEQRNQILGLYAQNAIEDCAYFLDNEHEQIAATALLASNHLNFDVRESGQPLEYQMGGQLWERLSCRPESTVSVVSEGYNSASLICL